MVDHCADSAHLWRYSAREMTRAANVLMLMRSMGEMSCPMLVLAASMMACAVSSSPVFTVSRRFWA